MDPFWNPPSYGNPEKWPVGYGEGSGQQSPPVQNYQCTESYYEQLSPLPPLPPQYEYPEYQQLPPSPPPQYQYHDYQQPPAPLEFPTYQNPDSSYYAPSANSGTDPNYRHEPQDAIGGRNGCYGRVPSAYSEQQQSSVDSNNNVVTQPEERAVQQRIPRFSERYIFRQGPDGKTQKTVIYKYDPRSDYPEHFKKY